MLCTCKGTCAKCKETFGPYSKKDREKCRSSCNGRLASCNLDKEAKAAEVEEKNSQEAYEKLISRCTREARARRKDTYRKELCESRGLEEEEEEN